MKTIKKIGVLCAYDFPEGMAPTIRILAYCGGLLRNNVKPEIFTFKETPESSDVPLSGTVNNISYQKSYIRHKGGFAIRLFDKFAMLKNLYKQIKSSNDNEAFDYFLLSFDTLDKFYTFVPLLKLLNQRLIFIGDEFPEPIRRLKNDIPRWHKIAYRIIHHYLDGRILMTKKLQKFYDAEVSVKPTYILNSIIDDDRFNGIKRESIKNKYLCYMGNMQLAKDNVDNIIIAFSMIAGEFPEYELRLYGTPSDSDRLFIESVIEETHMQQRVRIMGRVDYNKVPQILANASLLVTSQPITKRAEGGFPTKMAEYMMSGTPMLVTNVGEISSYVQDGINTFMVEPCNPQVYAHKIRYILSNPYIAEDVANNAALFAKSNFCSNSIAQGMIDFLNNLN